MSSTTIDQFLTAAPRRRSAVRLTRRGRIVVFMLALLVLMALALAGASLSGAAGESGAGVPTHTIVVAPGDTLWDLASDAAGGGSVREMEQRIKDLNGLDSGVLIAGQRLRIPQ